MAVFLKIVDWGGLKIPGNIVCKGTFYIYFLFHEVVDDNLHIFMKFTDDDIKIS